MGRGPPLPPPPPPPPPGGDDGDDDDEEEEEEEEKEEEEKDLVLPVVSLDFMRFANSSSSLLIMATSIDCQTSCTGSVG
jgi:hypothetical protein